MSDLRLMAAQEGIMDTFLHDVLSDTMRDMGNSLAGSLNERKLPKAAWDAVTNWQDSLDRYAIQVQQRTRVANWFVQGERTGGDLVEAARRTREALYDWTNGVSPVEQGLLTQPFVFFRFMRLAIKQAATIYSEPLFNPNIAVRAGTPMNRMRQIDRFTNDLVPSVFGPKYSDDEIQEEYAAAAGIPDWIRSGQPVLGVYPVSRDAQLRMYAEGNRKFLTHYVGILPSPTVTDVLAQAALPIQALILMALEASGEDIVAADFRAKLIEPITSTMFRGLGDLVEQGLRTNPRSQADSQDMVTLSPAVAAAMNAPYMPFTAWRDPETQKWKAPWWEVTVFNLIPVIGQNLPSLMNATDFRNPEVHGDIVRAVAWAVANYTRAHRMYPYNPEDRALSRQKDIKAELNRKENVYMGELGKSNRRRDGNR